MNEIGTVWFAWCGCEERFPDSEAKVQTIEEYFATDEVHNDYIDDEAHRVFHETKAMRMRANEAVMGENKR